MRGSDLDSRIPALARALEISETEARARLNSVMSACTPVLIIPLTAGTSAWANAWLVAVGERFLGVMTVRLVGARTEQACRDLLRDDDPDIVPGVHCQPVRMDRR
jgi:hypothetical protein